VPVDGWHRQTPEHVTVKVGVRVVHPALQPPTMQLVEAALPTGELEFDGQALHVELSEDPTAVEYVPAAQSLQTAEPVDALYLPATHAVHVPPSGPENPALQVQLVKAALPAGELEFDGQAEHATDPVNALYFPATHAEQVPPAGPVDPALQVQLVKAELPTGELEFDGQSVHAADPVNALYFPATHAEQVPPAGPENPALQVQSVKEVLPAGALEVPAVKSTPHTMRSAIAEVASVLRYSSTTKTPAMSPFK
jgi:hypothetical protein